MNARDFHPHTLAVLDAWRRLESGSPEHDPARVMDFPDLVGRLFVLQRISDLDYSFRRVGRVVEHLFGRALAEHDFLSVWNPPDRSVVGGALGVAIADNGPTVVHARGDTLHGRRVELEFTLAPLLGRAASGIRFLGLCQALTSQAALGGRPVRRMQATAIFLPAPAAAPQIRLVANDEA